MVSVLVDTSALYALLDEDDQNHHPAADLWPGLVRRERLTTHTYIVLEVSALVQRRLGWEAAHQLHDGLLAVVELRAVDLGTHQMAVTRWRHGGPSTLSLVDATSFMIMAESGIDRAFAFDQDFIDAGFDVVA